MKPGNRFRTRLCAMVVLGALVGATQAEELAGYSGADLYRRFCASCHGVTAHGDGPVSESLKLMVPDLTLLSRRHGGAFPADQVRRIIDGRSIRPPHGERDMPVWGFEFRAAGGDGGQTDQLIDRLINYLQSLQH